MKRLIIILTCLLLTGCGIGTVDDRLMVYAIGIDSDEGEYKVSYQVFTPKGESASSPVNVDQTNVAVISVKGETVEECDRRLMLQTGKSIFMEDAEVIIFGESVTDEQALELIDTFISSKSVYIGCGVAFCLGSGEDAMNIGRSGTKDPHSWGEILRRAYKEGKSPSPRLVDMYNSLLLRGECEISRLKLEKNEEGDPYPGGIESVKVIKK